MEVTTTLCLVSLFYIIFYICRSIFLKRDRCCYMLHYECYKAPKEQILDTMSCAKVVLRNSNLGLQEYRFLLRTMVGSGIGEQTYCPKPIIEGREESSTLKDSLSEMDAIIFDTLDNLFAKTGVSPSQIDIVVTSVSLFSPVPSLTARIMNRYKMRDTFKTFNLSGMGCSGSVIAIDVVQQLFKTYKNSYAIVVSTESMSANWYSGKEKSMMLSNILFRTGGCSMLFTNNRALKHRALMKLTSMVRTHIGSRDEAYGSCIQVEDELGFKGFHLSRSLGKSGAEALTMNFRTLLPKILPLWEILRYTIASYHRNRANKTTSDEGEEFGINLKSSIDHFCIHPGGRAIIDGAGKSLGLNPYDLEPARMALHRFGNTSSGGLWYVLGYMEAKKRLKKGDKILMISLGAGFKCNNCVWKVMKNMEDPNVWKDCIDQYPPTITTNPFADKFDWINDQSLDFTKMIEKFKGLNLEVDTTARVWF
ncbi:hypothetical protein K2173_018871 [Erythroxylum novogranatense]|uniref:3-ketoacyl-CoA synthase n=1 Tax=Erythroxylum novogranatense TaxID=1862640 RepID=A0AAV8SAX5_9ROSI|nr:hypothetical protein K2173_018871 [Erythroxylum novogranatense]